MKTEDAQKEFEATPQSTAVLPAKITPLDRKDQEVGVPLSQYLANKRIAAAIDWFRFGRKAFARVALQTPHSRRTPRRGWWEQRHTQEGQLRTMRLKRHPRRYDVIEASAK